MGKITFKCKGQLVNGNPCDKKVSANIHTGVAEVSGQMRQVVVNVEGLKIDKIKKDDIPDIPSDWEFTLLCTRGHEEDYRYDEREK